LPKTLITLKSNPVSDEENICPSAGERGMKNKYIPIKPYEDE